MKDVPLAVALEFAILLGYDGQLKQNSKLEIELFASTIKQLKKTKMSRLENALIWLYVKTWGAQGQHVLDQHGIWKFRPDDLDAAIMGIAYPKKSNKSDRIKDLQDLILGRFETGGLDEFYQWSKYFRNEVSSRPSDLPSEGYPNYFKCLPHKLIFSKPISYGPYASIDFKVIENNITYEETDSEEEEEIPIERKVLTHEIRLTSHSDYIDSLCTIVAFRASNVARVGTPG